MRLEDLREGVTEPGDCGYSPDEVPAWMDFEKFDRGRQFFLNHIGAVLFSCHCSLAVGLSLENLLGPLVFTGKSDTPEKAYRRYYKTFLHIGLWHIGNVWEKDSKAYKSVQKVRSMHTSVATRMKNTDPDRPILYVSQYDMAVVQFGFYATSLLYPEKFGIKCTRQDREDYVFFWRGIGYLLGIDDKYNTCSGNLEETVKLCKQMERELVLPAMLDPPKDFDRMAHAYVQITNIQIKFESMTKEAIFAFFMDITGLMEVGNLSFADYIRFYLLKWTAFMIRWCPWIEWLVNFVIYRMFYYDYGRLKL